MTQWMFDTLVWTAALIALVLLVRRPVARWFGPQVAYSLWALPMARLILPPITLPAWLAPEKAIEPATNDVSLQIAETDTPVATHAGMDGISPGSGAAATDWTLPFTPSSLLEAAPLVEIGCAVWLIGAAIFLWLRFGSYFKLRGQLLEGAREVGRSGKVRFVETPGTQTPLAFGVLDPVVALPEGFMAQHDIVARDLALAHELAHHDGKDLLINIAVQPLFALHWFNPLGRYGWLALRRDQEAACDARVVARKPAEERVAYASLIASVAAGPNVALAAPMACPVLGDKSIIHRLRSLNMSDTTPRRRWTGRALLGAAALALPLTASITYAEVTAPEVPEAPSAPEAPLAPTAPEAPQAPDAPAPPAQPETAAIVEIDPGTGETGEWTTEESVLVFRDEDEGEGARTRVEIGKFKVVSDGERLSAEEREKLMAELREELEDVDEEIEGAMKKVERAMVEIHTSDAKDGGRTVVKMECRGGTDEVATIRMGEGDAKTVYLCQSKVMARALKGLKKAREAIAKDSQIEGEMREEVLRELDRQIAEWGKDKG
ncbi:M56 family metallopeptidase [Erythrobacter sp. GH1-10]|uniref:M56 family metallopeptidase n=1 Tax=Erythrobacter sp. GH1-10 TaxID=3349334 RepID=UPI0038778F88